MDVTDGAKLCRDGTPEAAGKSLRNSGGSLRDAGSCFAALASLYIVGFIG